METKRKSVAEMNKEYFETFISSRGSIGTLNISIVGLVIALLDIIMTWNIAIDVYQIHPLESKINLVMIAVALFMAITFLVMQFWVTRQFLIKHQGFAGILLTICIVLLTFVLLLMCYIITQGDSSTEVSYGSASSLIVLTIFGLSYCGSLLLSYLWLKRQLRIGMTVVHTSTEAFAKIGVSESKLFWSIFAGTLLASFVMGSITRFFCFVFGLLFSVVFAQLASECGYAAVLLNKNKDYWVDYQDQPRKPIYERIKNRFKKLSTYVILSVLISVGIINLNSSYEIPAGLLKFFQWVTLAILVFWVIAFTLWVIKKIRQALSK